MSMSTQLSRTLPALIQGDASHSAIPLTTIFKPPPDCTPILYDGGKVPDGLSSSRWEVRAAIKSLSCYPYSNFDAMAFTGIYYSPGVCPLGWKYAATSVQHMDDDLPVTLAMCCPLAIASFDPVAIGCVTFNITRPEPPATKTTKTPPITVTTANAYHIPVAWRETDLTLFTPESAPLIGLGAVANVFTSESRKPQAPSSPTRPSIATTATSPSTAKPLASLQASPNDSKINAGMGAGIAIGALLPVLIGIGLVLCLFKQHKRRRREKSSNTIATIQDFSSTGVDSQLCESNSSGPEEVSGVSKPSELESPLRAELESPLRSELDGGWQAPEMDNEARDDAG